MKLFAALLERLAYTPARNAKLKLITDYFRAAPDPDRGWALAALTDAMPFQFPVRQTLRELIRPHVGDELYALSRDYVGDTAETVALLWPEPIGGEIVGEAPTLSEIVDRLMVMDRSRLSEHLAGWLDRLDANGRWALLKLLTGALRVGISARLAKTALARWGVENNSTVSIDEIEEVWHGLSPPYASLFAWCMGQSERPDVSGAPVFRPMMLANPLEAEDFDQLQMDAFAVEWKWDGIRIQIASGRGAVRLYSRTGEDIGDAFPDVAQAWRGDGVFDGELLVMRDGAVAPFADLQKRLNRKSVTARMAAEYPAHVRLYDALVIGDDDLRRLTFIERRARLESWYLSEPRAGVDLSPLISVPDLAALREIWSGTRGDGVEGLMLKRRDSAYLAGRFRGHWYKWKRAALTIDCVVMYAQRGSGKRSSYHSDFTFGLWTGEDEASLVTVGKAYSGFTDAELLRLDRWVRNNTLERFGPVRKVSTGLVFEVAFDAVQRSSRHKSGVAMRFPRIHRIRWDKPAAEADRLETLRRMIDVGGADLDVAPLVAD